MLQNSAPSGCAGLGRRPTPQFEWSIGWRKPKAPTVSARLREAGATVLTIARKRPDAFASDRLFVAADVATAEGCAAVASAVVEQLGGIDIVVFVAC